MTRGHSPVVHVMELAYVKWAAQEGADHKRGTI
jgi:hypothetical protein